MADECAANAAKCGCGTLFLGALAMIITTLASCREIQPEEQLLIKDPAGFYTVNGPWRGVLITHYGTETREGIVLQPEQYAVVKDKTTGVPRHENGPQLFFMKPYDEVLRIESKITLNKETYAIVKNTMTGDYRHEPGPKLFHPGVFDSVKAIMPKIVLEKDEYVRLVNNVTGAERMVKGPTVVVPDALEAAPEGKQKVVFLDTDSAALVLNRADASQRLVTVSSASGSFAPAAYESVLEVRPLIHVLPHEAVIIRDHYGQLEVRSGRDAQSEMAGTSFFLPPYSTLLEMKWSSYPELAADGSKQVPTIERTERIDMRVRKNFFRYECRTNDNVRLILDGALFWQVVNVSKTIMATADPQGDVWHHARSSMIQAVSNTTLQGFMDDFNGIVARAFEQEKMDATREDGFYYVRGVELHSMELTRFDCADQETSDILQQIIQEATSKINRLTAQQAENEVNEAALSAEILLEQSRTELIETKTKNEKLLAAMTGESMGTELVKGATTFIEGLNESVPDIMQRVMLYRMHNELKHRNTDTKNLAAGNTQMFLTPSDLDLQLSAGNYTSEL
jgi:regulator of protease activity HflC (stomatin/prohibitin superfamily)